MFFAQLAYELTSLDHLDRVNANRGFVKYQYIRLVQYRLSYPGPLSITFRQFPYECVAIIAQPDYIYDGRHAFINPRTVHAAQLTHIAEVVRHGHVEIEGDGLG